MNCFEDIIESLLNGNTDIAVHMLEDIDSSLEIGKSFIASESFHQLMVCLAGDFREEEIWSNLLPYALPDKIPDEVIEYLIKNRIALTRLCHMELSDKWLKKLISYDDAPLYTLSKRYFLQDNYSQLDFICFYQKYLCNRDYISIYLLEIYVKASKRELLLYLCSKDNEFKDKKKLEWYLVANQLKTMVDEDKITDIYEKYKEVSIIMLGIADNLFTAERILLNLSSVKGIAGANEIRKRSKETLSLKSNCESIGI